MKYKPNSFYRYLKEAPLALAIERMWECKLYKEKTLVAPILDIGCGDGIFANQLFSEPLTVGIDPNAHELERAKQYNIYKELIVCYGDQVPKEDGQFSTIISNSVMEHIPDIKSVLKEAHRLLNPSGRLYLTLPTDKFDHYTMGASFLRMLGLKKWAKRYANFTNRFWAHYHYYSRHDWEKLFSEQGYRVVSATEYGSRVRCCLNAFLSPFSILPFLTRKFLSRWFLSQKLRSFTAAGLSLIFMPFSKLKTCSEGQGGLIFFELEKR